MDLLTYVTNTNLQKHNYLNWTVSIKAYLQDIQEVNKKSKFVFFINFLFNFSFFIILNFHSPQKSYKFF